MEKVKTIPKIISRELNVDWLGFADKNCVVNQNIDVGRGTIEFCQEKWNENKVRMIDGMPEWIVLLGLSAGNRLLSVEWILSNIPMF